MDDLDGRWNRVAAEAERLMLKAGFGVEELATAAGLSRETVRPIIRGVPGNYRARTLAKISTALGAAPDHLQRIIDGRPVHVPFDESYEQMKGLPWGDFLPFPDDVYEWFLGLDAHDAEMVREVVIATAEIVLEATQQRMLEVLDGLDADPLILSASEVMEMGRLANEEHAAQQAGPGNENFAVVADKGKSSKPAKSTRHRPQPPTPKG